jgi:integrase
LFFWKTIIPAAWYTGLSFCDLLRVERSNILPGGVLVIERSKTKKRVVVWLPPELTRQLHQRFPGRLWVLTTSQEYFRRQFKKIAAAAGLTGSFKKLRKSSGTAIEILHPGRGHEHLGNTRQVFEQHYLSVAAMPLKPLKPPTIPRRKERQPMEAGKEVLPNEPPIQ